MQYRHKKAYEFIDISGSYILFLGLLYTSRFHQSSIPDMGALPCQHMHIVCLVSSEMQSSDADVLSSLHVILSHLTC